MNDSIQNKRIKLWLYLEVNPFIKTDIGIKGTYNKFNIELSTGLFKGLVGGLLGGFPLRTLWINSLFISHNLLKYEKHIITIGTGVLTAHEDYSSATSASYFDFIVAHPNNIIIPLPFLGYTYSSVDNHFVFNIQTGPFFVMSSYWHIFNPQTKSISNWEPYNKHFYPINIFKLGARYMFLIIKKK